MKQKLGVKPNKPLADFLPTITIKAKDFATEMTIFNVKDKASIKEMKSPGNISQIIKAKKTIAGMGYPPGRITTRRRRKKTGTAGKNRGKKFIEKPDKLKNDQQS